MNPTLQAAITLLLVAMAAAYLGRTLYRQLRSREAAGCDQCSGAASRQPDAPNRRRPADPPRQSPRTHHEHR